MKALDIFRDKISLYGDSWLIMRLSSLTDQMLIKAMRIRTIEISGVQKVSDSIIDEYIGIYNYAAMSLIRIDTFGFDIPNENHTISKAICFMKYNEICEESRNLQEIKDFDYGSSWKMMRITSITDQILMKLMRLRSIEDLNYSRIELSDIRSIYLDIMNYCGFAIYKSSESFLIPVNLFSSD